ncbi:biotin-independent malonate decarboxylase subunit beta [Peribacillus glennii]|uniref:Biotin-independent malonate decarboxylase subunit beta n=1 Tax=Peribacillus glennii TaxID=2303991 RepID=A0A372LG76_9BACI|nr:biotin-independent malonate decarboxylase subunit beta [Peribacillus glennii]RFU64962.1 biotin-independent malonate decarboxylase subunit beta [Peribacillus glennii]
MAVINKVSFIELNARERAAAVLDEGTHRELLCPFDGLESPHLPPQGIVPQSDDGVVIVKGKIGGKPAVVISIEGAFQGGGIGEVSGAKIAGALELALRDNKLGKKTFAVVLFDTGGVRLQEANYGLLAISEIQSAVVALRKYVNVVGVIPGDVGSFGGMSITAALFNHLIMTKEARFGLNGPEVIEQEAGIKEFDSSNRPLIWGTIGGTQRVETGFADVLANDDMDEIKAAIAAALTVEKIEKSRTEKVDLYRNFLSHIDPFERTTPQSVRELWRKMDKGEIREKKTVSPTRSNITESRGRTWLTALTGMANLESEIPTVVHGEALLADEIVSFISVVPDLNNRFPRARNGEVGLDEGWAIAKYVRDIIESHRNKDSRRAIVAIVDVPSQAYGYREELLGIHLACAAAVDAYATARLAGHPVISLIVGKAISGAFLAHGYQSNQLIALNDEGVSVHAMSKQSAARITRRTIAELEKATSEVPAMAYDIASFSKLGAVDELLDGINADVPQEQDIITVKNSLISAIDKIRSSPIDLKSRLETQEALNGGRTASIKVRELLEKQWS